MAGDRFRDDGVRIHEFADRVLVRCPRCVEVALVRAVPPEGASVACGSCGYSTQVEDLSPSFVLAEGVDPYFGLEVALQTPVASHTLWAWNDRHLAWLKGYVGARLRERRGHENGALASRLPRWLKDAKNRDAILEGITRLEGLLAAATRP